MRAHRSLPQAGGTERRGGGKEGEQKGKGGRDGGTNGEAKEKAEGISVKTPIKKNPRVHEEAWRTVFT